MESEERLGEIDAAAGAPDPLAESRDEERQPPARLSVFFSAAVAQIRHVREATLDGLNEIERLHLALPAQIARVESNCRALAQQLIDAPVGRERWLARWRFTVIAAAVALGFPAEVYLTSLSLAFLDVREPWAPRYLAVGIALALALTALVAANGEERRERKPRQLALAVVVLMLGGLALLRWGVTPNASFWEESGAVLVLAVAAVAYVLWTVRVKRTVEKAVAEHSLWQQRGRFEHLTRAANGQRDLLVERRAGLPANAQSCCDRAIAQLSEIPAAFVGSAGRWWAAYQEANAAAAPDIRSQREGLNTDLEGHVLAATAAIENRTRMLRSWMSSDLPEHLERSEAKTT